MVKEEAKVEVKNSKPTNVGFDINKLIDKARSMYGKKEAGAAKQIATGATIVRPYKDSDFILWGDHFKALTGIRGIPFGQIVQFSGKPDAGKSSAAMLTMKQAQDQGCLVILWDAEGKFSRKRYDEKMGGRSEQLAIVDTNNIIDGIKHVANLIHAVKELNPNTKVLVVWDSVGASVTSTEDNEENEDYSKQPGVNAREVGYAVKKIKKLSSKYFNRESGEHSIAMVVVNQVYANIGPMTSGVTEKGGAELQYLSSLIIQMNRKNDLTKTRGGIKMKHGIVTRAKVKKNHLFDGDDCVAELDLEVSASGIKVFGKNSEDELEVDDEE
jgi:RecA/RadA recombinase